MKVKLKQTCGSCPEQYDVFDEDMKYIGYFRLRHGYFRVEDAGGNIVFDGEPKGDGIFEWDEREAWLAKGTNALIAHYEEMEEEKEIELPYELISDE